jgi:hypothetical protein
MKPRGNAQSLWIWDPWKDLALFVLSPVWVVPLLWWLKAHFDIGGFGAILLAVGGVGHHLPGFIRAYTDFKTPDDGFEFHRLVVRHGLSEQSVARPF